MHSPELTIWRYSCMRIYTQNMFDTKSGTQPASSGAHAAAEHFAQHCRR